ncbi:uncharacterized protein SPSK_04390 [Sporothrix schenckii 1099-18]|nr:uncharacterized protein SPSK_04390 [Sporothrix schenckii 1099-18]KJR83616.1 hypothetical protein SPSK_04390 [Sporothrix schenckii 1099-18]
MAALDDMWTRGLAKLSYYECERRRLLRERSEILLALSKFFVRPGEKTCDIETEWMRIPRSLDFDDDALIDTVTATPNPDPSWTVSFYRSIPMTRDPVTQNVWCPILGSYVHRTNIARCPVLKCLGVHEGSSTALFGGADDRPGGELTPMKRPENGMVMCGLYKELVDSGRATILPLEDNEGSDGEKGSSTYVIYLLDGDLRKPDAPDAMRGLHRKRLQFRGTSYRPSKDFLRFKFIINALHQRRCDVPTDVPIIAPKRDDDAVGCLLPNVAQALWNSLGALPRGRLRQCILFKFSVQFGCLSRENAQYLWNVSSEPPVLADDEEKAATIHALEWTVACNRVVEDREVASRPFIDEMEIKAELDDMFLYGQFPDEWP